MCWHRLRLKIFWVSICSITREHFFLLLYANLFPKLGESSFINQPNKVIWYAVKVLNKALSEDLTTKRDFPAVINYTKHFKRHILDRRLHVFQKIRDLDALSACCLEILAIGDYESFHTSQQTFGIADCISRLPVTDTSVNKTSTIDVNTSTDTVSDFFARNLPPSNSQPPQEPTSNSATIPRHLDKNLHTDKEWSHVEACYGATENCET